MDSRLILALALVTAAGAASPLFSQTAQQDGWGLYVTPAIGVGTIFEHVLDPAFRLAEARLRVERRDRAGVSLTLDGSVFAVPGGYWGAAADGGVNVVVDRWEHAVQPYVGAGLGVARYPGDAPTRAFLALRAGIDIKQPHGLRVEARSDLFRTHLTSVVGIGFRIALKPNE